VTLDVDVRASARFCVFADLRVVFRLRLLLAEDERLQWRVPGSDRTTQLWTLANVGFFVQRMNSFESEARRVLAG
jgi:hypothetical protein